MGNSRFLVRFSIEDSVEIELPENATEKQIDKAARNEIYRQISKARGVGIEIQIGSYVGPY